MIRIVHVVAAPEFARLILRHELRHLADSAQHIIVASPGNDLEVLEADGFRVIPLRIARKLSPLADIASILRLAFLLRRLRPDLVQTYTPKAGLVGQIAGALAGIGPRIHSCRGLLYRPGLPAWRRWLFRRTDRLTCALADRVAFVSNADRDHLVSEGLCAASKARVTGNGVEVEHFRRGPGRLEARRECREALGYADDEKVVLTVGRFVADKGYLDVIEAIPRLPDQTGRVRFLWVAPEMSGESGVLADTIFQGPATAGLVRRLGRRDDMPRIYHAADLLLHPSHREGVPRVLMEAAASGLPIVASDIPGNREVVELGRSALGFHVGDPSSLAEALVAALGDPDRMSAMASAASADAAARMDVASVGSRVSLLHAELKLGALPALARWKRPLDLALAALLAMPILVCGAATAVAVWVGLGRPLFFVQERPGLGGRPFRMVKFRTMTTETDLDGNPLPDGARLTRFGRLLRATSLDELPEILNVFRGEMSFVGPRPLLVEYLPLYSNEQARRMDVLPGITGWAQVKGRNAVSWTDRFCLDVWYVDNATVWVDLQVLVMTIGQVLLRRGVNHPGHATMERFGGNNN